MVKPIVGDLRPDLRVLARELHAAFEVDGYVKLNDREYRVVRAETCSGSQGADGSVEIKHGNELVGGDTGPARLVRTGEDRVIIDVDGRCHTFHLIASVSGAPYGTRTHVLALKGRPPGR